MSVADLFEGVDDLLLKRVEGAGVGEIDTLAGGIDVDLWADSAKL